MNAVEPVEWWAAVPLIVVSWSAWLVVSRHERIARRRARRNS